MINRRQATLRPLLAALVAALVVTGARYYIMVKIANLAAYYESIIVEQQVVICRQGDTIQRLRQEAGYQQLRIDTLSGIVDDGFAGWVPVEMEVTGYAPLDPEAVPGICYSGDPNITASGEPSQPGISIAAGPSVPFGTEIYIPGYGVGVVHDRGGMITDDRIDLMFATRDEAMEWGRQTVTVWVRE